MSAEERGENSDEHAHAHTHTEPLLQFAIKQRRFSVLCIPELCISS